MITNSNAIYIDCYGSVISKTKLPLNIAVLIRGVCFM